MMGDATAIEWTDATWNPVTGCTAVSSGCDHCYAQTLAERFRGTPGHYFEHGFDVELRPGKLEQPLRWSRPRRIFVNSMSDLFHPEIPDDYIARVFAVIALARQHTFQLLTKRPARMRSLLQAEAFRRAVDDAIAGVVAAFRPADVWYQSWPLPNLWIGVSAEDQKTADLRVWALLDTPAALRFVSAEPLLGPIDFTRLRPSRIGGALTRDGLRPVEDSKCGGELEPALDWVIVGGESGREARPMHPRWVRDIRDQCTAADVPFLFKQWGEWAPAEVIARFRDYHHFDDGTEVRRVGRKAAGRILDRRVWDSTPDGAGR